MSPDISSANYYKVEKKINHVAFWSDYFKDMGIQFR